ncbi:MAG: hypothetical protein JW795_20540 [Chitinivibrionales bacterium]|nr:hypothetical protein [Chitinivibrionales bacterium]
MKELTICKSCGFIMEKAKLRDKCPACGVPAKMFLPYAENISARRRLILSLDIHPVLVHFPQAFTATILLLSLLALFMHGSILAKITATITVLCYSLPFVVLSAFAAGLLDGKIRFRRVTTPLLKRKIILGILFFVISGALFFLAMNNPSPTPAIFSLIAILSGCALVCASILALIGVSILHAKFPG